uniref:Neurotransmitter-gated ion-channel transmembrane region n=1 Tax=Musca domestica TaxID=7370 RepID=T1PEM0_MUSDO
MTFYWWSHWFWITLICNLFMPHIMVVHSYPSLDGSLERNQHEPEKKMVTKLYQASTTLTWYAGDSSTNSPMARTTTYDREKTRLQSVSATTVQPLNTTPLMHETEITRNSNDNNNKKLADGFEDPYYYYDEYDINAEEADKIKPLKLEDVEEEQEEQQQSFSKQEKQSDIKRSAEDLSRSDMENLNTATLSTTVTSTPTTNNDNNNNNNTSSHITPSNNNYTNFTDPLATGGSNNTMSQQQQDYNNSSSSPSTLTSNSLKANILMASASILATSINSLSVLTTQNVTQLPPGTPKITRPTDWLRSIDDAVAAVSPPPLSVTTTDVSNDKFPFTLENVHKSEDLRRDENEPRRRQSKGLSADYKPPGYINYSPESKNLLTRSASTTVNDYDSEESNISSEALSVQRAYFMDVGAISAICFTVFGICCTVGTIGIVLYRRRFLNKPQALSEPDSSVYIDDSTMRVSDNSDEMYSLDNDSFLNSLEAMTIQNYWTDTVKHTKL